MTPFERALATAARFLEAEGIPYMVIGGVANLIWGLPRTTLDVDITVWVEEVRLATTIERVARTFRILPEDPLGFVRTTRVLPLETKEGVRVELVFGQLPYEQQAIQRARPHELAGVPIRVCSPEDLVVHKILADRPQDREDIRGIIRRLGVRLDRAYLDPLVEGLAHDLARPDLLAFYRACLGLPEGPQP